MKTKVIFSPQLAQWLLHKNYSIVDIKPKREYPNETVFVFKVDEGFEDEVASWLDAKERQVVNKYLRGTRVMMEHLFKSLMEEKHDFYHYLDLHEECTDPTTKATLYTLAEQEMHHYKLIHDIVFKEVPGKV